MNRFEHFTSDQLHAIIAGLDSVIMQGEAERQRVILLKQAKHTLRTQYGLVLAEAS